MSSTLDAVDIESMQFVTGSTSGGKVEGNSTMPRWKRKQMEREKLSNGPLTPTKINIRSHTPKSHASQPRSCLSVERSAGKSKRQVCDRFIPNRSDMDMDLSSFRATGVDASSEKEVVSQEEIEAQQFRQELGRGMGIQTPSKSRILSFAEKAPAPKAGYHDAINMMWTKNSTRSKTKRSLINRVIPDAPDKVLDAPEMMNDYYLNLVDWNCNNVLGVALSQTVYLWDAASGNIVELMSIDGEDQYVSSVSWIQSGGNVLAVGTSKNTVELWDVNQKRRLRTMDGHQERVGVMSWNNHVLTSGSRDTSIIDHDVRVQNHVVNTYKGHSQEVCGLTWNADGNKLASGGNDNLCAIWDRRRAEQSADVPAVTRPTYRLTDHIAAVKALAWCPHQQNLLATGGGTADKCIKLWNTNRGKLVNSLDTGSQVCSLLWSPDQKELLSGHGFSEFQLALWKVGGSGKMTKLKELKGAQGHQGRVLSLCGGAQGMVCSAGADETLRFWNIFGGRSRDGSKKKKSGPVRGTLNPAFVSRRVSSRMMLR